MKTLIVLLFIAGVIALQIFLSKQENKWLGLILPIISFLVSLIYPLNMAVPVVNIGVEMVNVVLSLLLGLLIANIPTYILLAIYYACRGKYRKRKQLDKMNIQDLE